MASSACASPTGSNRPRKRAASSWDASGHPTKVEAADTSSATGVYLTSEGIQGDAVWSTRGRWCTLTGHTGPHTAAIAIIDHPSNPGYPTTWHARGLRPLRRKSSRPSIFNPKLPTLNLTLEKNQTATFRYRVILFSHAATAKEMNSEADAFAAEMK